MLFNILNIIIIMLAIMDPFTGRGGEWGAIVFFGATSCLLLESQLSVLFEGLVGAMSGAWRVRGREAGNGNGGGEGTHGSSETLPVCYGNYKARCKNPVMAGHTPGRRALGCGRRGSAGLGQK